MDAYALAKLIYGNDWVRFIGALIVANVLLGVGSALFKRNIQFYLGSLADFLLTRVLPYLLGWGAVKLVAYTAMSDYLVVAQATEAAVSLFVLGALLGKIADQLRILGLPIPTWAGDKPRLETTATT
jgi:hypothetical protein